MQRLQKNNKPWIKPRIKNNKDMRKTFYLYCWWKTEKFYLSWIKKELSNKTNIKIVTMDFWWKDCLTLLKKSISEKKIRWKDPLDFYYIIIDRDPGNNTEEQFKEIIKLSWDNNITPIISNISIEVRFLMHFSCYMEWNWSVSKYIKKLSKLLNCKYSKTDENIYEKLKWKTLSAINNAKQNEKFLIENSSTEYIFQNEPYTSMHKLVSILLNI